MARVEIADAVTGALAGAMATKVMGRVTTFMYERQPDAVTRREEAARGGKTSFVVAAEKIAGLAGRKLSDDQSKKLGSALHWALSMTGGAVYAVLRRRMPRLSAGAGVLFGTAFFLLIDEGVNWAFGFTPGPRAFPWQAHARGLAGHLTYGVGTELQLRAAARVVH